MTEGKQTICPLCTAPILPGEPVHSVPCDDPFRALAHTVCKTFKDALDRIDLDPAQAINSTSYEQNLDTTRAKFGFSRHAFMLGLPVNGQRIREEFGIPNRVSPSEYLATPPLVIRSFICFPEVREVIRGETYVIDGFCTCRTRHSCGRQLSGHDFGDEDKNP